jgi:hypothetical protein
MSIHDFSTHVTHTLNRKEHIDFEELAPPAAKHFSKKITHFALEGIINDF